MLLVLLQAKALIEAIATSTSPNERVQLLKVAVPIFRDMPNSLVCEMTLAISVLVHCYRRAVKQREWMEVNGLASLLTCLVGGASSTRAAAVTKHYAHIVVKSMVAMVHGESTTKSVVSGLLHEIASFCISVRSMERIDQVLLVLQNVLREHTEHGPFVARTVMQLLVGLSQHTDNKICLMRSPGFVQDVLAVQLETVTEPMACFLKNLAWETRNRVAMIETTDLLSRLVQLSALPDMRTCLHVMMTIRRMSLSACNKNKIVAENGMVQAIITATQRDDLQMEAVSILLCLIGPETIKSMISPELVASLIAIAMQSEKEVIGCDGQQASVIAAHCFKKLSTSISVEDKHHQVLVISIRTLARSTNSSVRKWAAAAFLEFSRKRCTGFVLVRDGEAMASINELANDEQAFVRAPATEALMSLLSNAANLKRFMLYNDIVDTIVDNSKDWCEHTSRRAIQAMLALVDHAPLRPRIAKQLDLVASLSQFGVSEDSDQTLKQAALRGVIVLAPLM